jgi:dihydroorotase
MSKFLGLGFPLEEVVAIATVDPAKLINRLPKLGTCRSVPPEMWWLIELIEAPVSFVETRNNTHNGAVYLQPV